MPRVVFRLWCTIIVAHNLVSNAYYVPHEGLAATFSNAELDKAKFYINETQIVMTQNEVALLIRHLSSANKYFEFGSGGSTSLACMVGKPTLEMWTIDSSAGYLGFVKSRPCLVTMDSSRFHVVAVDVGRVGMWGYPDSRHTEGKKKWAQYSLSIGNVASTLDVVLIDGRFRVACAAQAMLRQPNAKILVHDFLETGHHKSYKELLNVSEVTEAADSLVIIRRKTDVTDQDLERFWRHHHANVM